MTDDYSKHRLNGAVTGRSSDEWPGLPACDDVVKYDNTPNKARLDRVHVIWDLEDDLDGNVQHILDHGVTMDEAEDVLLSPTSMTTTSKMSGERITFGHTIARRHLAVVWEHVQDDPLTMRPITAYDAPEPLSRRFGP